MKKLAILSLVLIFVLFGCAEKSDPEFTYVKNYSDYPISITYDGNTETVEAAEYNSETGVTKPKTKVLSTTSDLTYSLEQEEKTFVDENGTEQQDTIQVLNAETYGGFYDGDYCNIVKFTNNSDLNFNEKYVYNVTNNTSTNKIMYAESFSNRATLIESGKTINVTFLYKNPEIYFFNEDDYSSYETETDETKKETLLSELKQKSIQFSGTPETQNSSGFTIYYYSLSINE